MAKIALTDAGLRSLESPARGQACFWDDKLANFGCRVSQGGTKTFVLNHKNTLVTIGRYPTISLSQARTEAKRLLAEFTLGKVRPQSVTYKQAVELFLEEKGKARRGSTVAAYKGLLTSVTLSGQLADLTHEEVRRKLSRFTTGGAYNHRLVALTVFFNWCAKRRYITDNPARGLSKHSRATRARVLSCGELGRVWKAAGEAESQFGLIVRLLILTGARRGEIAALRWSWIDGDGISWPAEVMKSNRAHWLPLLPLAKSVLTAIPRKDDLLFPARGRDDRPFSGWSKATPRLWRLSEVEGATLHDIRRSWASHNAAWAAPHILERALSHASGQISGVAAVYNRFQYEDELIACYQNWERYLQEKVLV